MMIQTLEDMLRSCALDMRGCEDHLLLVEFVYNNNFQASILMARYEALYGRMYQTPICWFEVVEWKLLGPEIVSASHGGENPIDLRKTSLCSVSAEEVHG